MKRNLLSASAFLLILALLLGLLSFLFLPKGNALEDGIQEPELYAFLGERSNSLDVVVLGDSIPLCSFVPAYLWRSQGITSYVCANTAQKPSESVRILREFLARQTPRVVLLETDQLYLQETILDVWRVRAEALLPVLRFHDNWKFVRPGGMLREASYTNTTPEKGYHLRKLVEGLDPGMYMQPDDSVEPISSTALSQVKEIQKLCGESGAMLVLYTAPNAASWNMPRHNAMEALAKELDLIYLDCNVYIDMNWESDTLDGGEHLNIQGAGKVTRWLGDVLEILALCPDRREDPAYAHWMEDLAEFERRVDDPDEYY